MSSLKIAVAQINCTVGDLAANRQRILEACGQARSRGADLVLTPELALCGYPPEDLLLRPDFYRACRTELARLAAEVPVPVIVGHPDEYGGKRYNAASLLRDGRVEATYRKHRLPNYEVFDEQRYFAAAADPCVIEVKGVRIGLNICADVWEAPAAAAARAAGAQLLVAINASPFHMNKQHQRYEVLRSRVADTGIPVIYANMVGGQDELVFDGASFALDAGGRLTHQMPAFVEALDIIEVEGGHILPGAVVDPQPIEGEVYAALKLGVRDYLGKNGFPGAIIGLSGGIDSALTLCIAADALGPDRVRAVMMPSPYTAQMSLDDSRALVAALGVRYDELAIEPAMGVFAGMLAPLFADLPPTAWADTTPENIQARIRGMTLMALSNRTGSIVLTTGNKSEMAVGYATLYGDMAGGFAVIKDVFKTFVYRLSRYRNTISAAIPENIITRAPSAELKPGQTDQDSLPPYEMLDAIIEAYMERDQSPREIVAQGFPETEVRRVVGMLKRNEYKRRQSPVGIRITKRGFGKDWRYPITSRYSDEW
ncbi:MAG: NAD+ synthase [Sterolibacteriaceae bacterium MAG5]|nr:NAD+ synthase [Candidatus Nitricoxidireducens bremensis]